MRKLITLITLLIAIGLADPAYSFFGLDEQDLKDKNLVLNPGFENGDSEWTSNGSHGVQTSVVGEGTTSYKITNPSSGQFAF